MDLTSEISAFKNILPSSSTFVILLPETASRDAVAGGLSLYLSLINLQKNVTIAYPKQPIVGWSHLIGINKLTQKLGNKNFVISLDYLEGSIEKVSYNIEGNKFNLVIEPRPGAPQFDEKKVKYRYSGMVADAICAIAVQTKEALGTYYSENQSLFEQKEVIVIDTKAHNSQFGKLNIVRPSASVSELVAHFIKDAQLPINSDIATNLFDGVISGSRNFVSPAVNADTFAAASWLMQQGARKGLQQPQRPNEEKPRREFSGFGSTEAPQAPPDWLKPKIYKGSTLL